MNPNPDQATSQRQYRGFLSPRTFCCGVCNASLTFSVGAEMCLKFPCLLLLCSSLEKWDNSFTMQQNTDFKQARHVQSKHDQDLNCTNDSSSWPSLWRLRGFYFELCTPLRQAHPSLNGLLHEVSISKYIYRNIFSWSNSNEHFKVSGNWHHLYHLDLQQLKI